jgi:hypothetical protein
MDIGSLAAPKNPRNALACGCGVYDRAVVVSLQPFVLISEEGDMRWSATVAAADFEKVGDAGPQAARNVLDRLGRDPETAEAVGADALRVLRGIAAAGFDPVI